MNEKCYVVMEDTEVYGMGEYGESRVSTNILAVTKTKEKAFELIQKYGEEASIPDYGDGVEKVWQSDGWRISTFNAYEGSTVYCIEFDLQ